MIRTASALTLGLVLAAAAHAQLPPAPVYGTLLNAIELETRPGDVRLKVLPTSFVFLPEREGTIDLLRDGERVAGFTWSATRGNPPFLVVENVQMQWPEFDPLGFQLTQGGAHELVYHVGGEPFWRFPFEVVEVPSDDPYAPGSAWRLAGPWADHAYVLHDDSQGGTWDFKLWLQTDDFGGDTQYGRVHVTREGSDTPVLVAGGPNYVLPYSTGGWQRFDFQLSRTDGSIGTDGAYTGRQSFRAASEPLADGAYTLTFYHNGAVYGRYPFTVSGGEIVPTGAQAPGAEAQTRIDGGGAATWLFREAP